MTATGKSWRSGWCGLGLPPESHARCSGERTGRDGETITCVCEHHLLDAHIIQTASPAEPLPVRGDGADPEGSSGPPDASGTVRAGSAGEAPEPTGARLGIYADMPNADYHGMTDWFSSTQLKRALPEYYREGGSQEALDFGTLVHAVVLEPDNLGHYLPADAEKIGVKADGTPAQNPTMTTAWKRFTVQAEEDGKTVVAQADWDRAHAMRDAILAHGEAAELLFTSAGVAEESAFVVDEAGVRHKARFDRRIDSEVIDLKTSSGKPGAEALKRTIIDYGYEVSAAHYLEVAALLDLQIDRFTWVFVGKTEPYRVSVCDVDADFIERGLILRDRAIRRLTDPDVEPYEGASGRLHLSCPPWARLTPTTTAGISADFTWSINDFS